MAASSLTLGILQLLVWFGQRASLGPLLFFLLALSAAAFGAFELVLMESATAAAYATTLRWAHIPLAAFVLSMVGFVYSYFGTGNRWLALTTCALRLLGLGLNFTTGANLNYREVTEVNQLVLWGGETVSTPVGVINPWTVVPQLANVTLIVFVMGAAIELWRRGDAPARRRAAVVGGSLVACIGFAAGFSTLTLTGAVHAPTMVMPSVFILVLAMGHELARDVIMAAQIAARLRASEARFRAVVQSVPNAILLVDAQGAITFANAQVRSVFGYTPDELVGKHVEDLVPHEVRDTHEGNRRAYVRHAEARAMGVGRELFGRRKDGTAVPVEVGLNPMHIADGLVVLVSVVDVSERRRIEQSAAHQRNELAHLSRVSTLGELSGSLAHELNQPLTAIMSNAQAGRRLLAGSNVPQEAVREIFADIIEDDRRAGEVIRRLRSLLQKGEVQRAPVDVNAVVQDVLGLMRSDFISREVTVATDLAPGMPMLEGDRIQLQQVLLNLLVNACDAMDGLPDCRRVTIRTGRVDEAAVEILVSDEGKGIKADDLNRIFEPFVTTKPAGMGLGLAVCRTIVDAHGGTLSARSNAGDRGATFTVVLPVPPAQ